MTGYGLDDYGTGVWGLGETEVGSGFVLTKAEAVAENVVRVTFSAIPYFSEILDEFDASVPEKFGIAPVAGTIGLDDQPARPVYAVGVALVTDDDYSLDVTVDRPMTSHPAEYVIVVTGVGTDVGSILPIDSVGNVQQFFAVFKRIERPTVDAPGKGRDFHNPQTREAMFDPLPNPNNAMNLGTFVVDEQHDYAFDEGTTSFKKRVIRRALSRKSAFAHLPGYGLGLPDYGKKLGRAAERTQLIGDAENQFSREPEAQAVRVKLTSDPKRPELWRMSILIKTKSGGITKLSLPIVGA